MIRKGISVPRLKYDDAFPAVVRKCPAEGARRAIRLPGVGREPDFLLWKMRGRDARPIKMGEPFRSPGLRLADGRRTRDCI